MNKVKILTVSLLLAASFSSMSVAQQINESVGGSQGQDVAQLLYQVNRDLVKSQGKMEAANDAVLRAHEDYISEPNASTYKSLIKAATYDAGVVQQYNTIVAEAKKVEAKIETAEGIYYEETPATQAEIETGPKGKGTTSKGESVESELKYLQGPPDAPPPPALVAQLKKEIIQNRGSNFAEQLNAQKEKLESVKKRIETESQSEAVKSNPTAQRENSDLQSILSKAIDARRKALRED